MARDLRSTGSGPSGETSKEFSSQATAIPSREDPPDWELELRWFHACGTAPEEYKPLLKDLWRAYCDIELRAERAEQPWQSIETAPKDGTKIQGYGPHDTDGWYIDTIHCWRGNWTIKWMHGFGEPTHWRPLPAPPPAPCDEPPQGEDAPSAAEGRSPARAVTEGQAPVSSSPSPEAQAEQKEA